MRQRHAGTLAEDVILIAGGEFDEDERRKAMALQAGSIFDSDTAGTSETISLLPVPPATNTQVLIGTAFYGTDSSGAPKPVTVSADRRSLTLNMIAGINSLTVTLTSPDPSNQPVNLVQGSLILATPTVRNHSGFSSIFLRGQ